MMCKKLTLSFKLLIVFALVLGIVFPCLAVYGSDLSASAETAVASSSADWTPSYNGSYYNNINSHLTGTALRAELETLITSTHNTRVNSYDNLKSQFMKTDVDPATGQGLLWFYTGTKVSSYAGSPSNREHVWPKDGGAAFPEKTGPGCDLQHLRPTDTQLNSTRGSLSFDEIKGGSVVKENGSTSYANLCYKSGSFFYPGEGYRGATARILFYVQTRWGTQYNLEFVDSAGHCKTIGKISTLLKWHLEEPPTESEIYRNQKAYEIQGNRNPFVDHPEYATAIYCNDGNSYNNALKQVVAQYGDYGEERPDLESLAITPNTISLTAGAEQTLTVTATPSNANADVTWSSSNTAVATVNGGKVTAVSNGTAVITATSVNNPAIKATVTVNVKKAVKIELSGTPTTTQYQAGQTFNPAGITVKVTYDDNSSANFSSVNDLKQFKWVDADTNQPTLMQTTTKIKCKFGDLEQTGNWTVTVSAPPEHISGFVTSVNAVTSATTLQARFDAIKAALEAYNNLSATERNNPSAQGAYQTLQDAIADYNADVNKHNSTMESAVKTGVYAICSASLAAAAIVIILNRKFN